MASRKRPKASATPSVRPCCRPNASARALPLRLAPAERFPRKGQRGHAPHAAHARCVPPLVRSCIRRGPALHPRLAHRHRRHRSRRRHLLFFVGGVCCHQREHCPYITVRHQREKSESNVIQYLTGSVRLSSAQHHTHVTRAQRRQRGKTDTGDCCPLHLRQSSC